jgi:hypothetical protein
MMGNYSCEQSQARFSCYLDGRLTGKEMQRVAGHMERCSGCAGEFDEWRAMQSMLGEVKNKRAPEELGLRLRVAISQEAARARRPRLEGLQLAWENTMRPLLVQWSVGLAGTALMLGALAVLVGMFAAPEAVQAASAPDEPLGMATSPQFLYASFGGYQAAGEQAKGSDTAMQDVVVEAFINAQGRVYDYRILSGPTSAKTRAQLNNMLYFSVFKPARVFGQPVRGHVVMSFAGIAVKG